MYKFQYLKICELYVYKMEFVEYVNIENAKYFINLTNERIMSEMYDPLETDQNGYKIKDIDGYINRIKKYCKRAIFNKGKVSQKYYYSKKLNNKGRLFVRGFGLQSIQNDIRGFLINKDYSDYDMVNAAPCILQYLIKEFLPHKNYPNLNNYVLNRNQILNEYGITKLDVIICLFSDKSTKHTDYFLQNLDKEFKNIQEDFWNLNIHPEIKDISKYNKKASFLCYVLHIWENKILQECRADLNMAVPMFDGFLSNENSEKVLEQVNNNKYGIKWIIKPHSNKIVVDEGLIIENTIMDYETTKINFEDKYFMIQNPVMFGREYYNEYDKKETIFYTKSDFDILTSDIQFDGFNKKSGEIEKKNFFKEWLKDPNKRIYQKNEWIPNNTYDNEKIYNTFTGFKLYEEPRVYKQDAINLFLDHIKLLVNYDEDSFRYVLNYNAQMIQYPDELPAVALLFKSQQGIGKDLMLDIIERIIGAELMYRTSKLDEIFGNFNGALKNNLIVQLNEVQGCDGFENKEKLKDLITSKTHNINEKNMKPYKQNNYSRVFIFSNNLNPIEIPYDDRRFCVFKGGKNKSSSYYKALVNILDNEDALKSILSYLKNVDLSNFHIREDRPKTSAYEDMKQNAINPIYTFLSLNFMDLGYAETFQNKYRLHKNNLLIKAKDFYHTYKDYLDYEGLEYVKVDYKKLKNLLNDIGIIKKQFKIKNMVTDYYVINQNNLINELESRNLIEEIETIE